MRMVAIAALVASASPATGQPAQAPRDVLVPLLTEWRLVNEGGARVLRAVSADQTGKLLLICDDERRLVATVMTVSDNPQSVATTTGSGRWIIDGEVYAAPGMSQVIPINAYVMSLLPVDGELLGRMRSANAAGFIWVHNDEDRYLGFQLQMTGGRQLLGDFARACNAQAYP